MLPTTSLERLAPGSNLRDRGRGDSWVLWLPDLEVRRAVAVGHVPAAIREHLRRAADRYDEVPAHEVPPAGAPAGLLVLDRRTLRRLARDPGRRRAVRGAVGTPVVVVVGHRAASDRTLADAATLLDAPVSPRERAVLLPRGTDTAAPHGARQALAVPSLRAPATQPRPVRVARAALRLARHRLRRGGADTLTDRRPSDLTPLVPTPTTRHQAARLLVVDPEPREAAAPPRWLRRLLDEAGIVEPLEVRSFAAPRGYRSQKTMFVLGTPDTDHPHLVVKATQEPQFNHRLEAEVHALRLLSQGGVVDPGTVPRVLDAGHYAGLAVAVETWCQGTSFRAAGSPSIDAPHVAAMLDWLRELAVHTARPDPRPHTTRRGELQELVDRYVDLDQPSPPHRARLHTLADLVADGDVPTVFFHGDPGTWNLRVQPDGRVGVLDWENARPDGPPLWDLHLFLRSVEQLVDAQSGRRHTAAAHVQRWGDTDTTWRAARQAVAAQTRDLGIPVDVAHALQVLCWGHHALRHATRRSPDAPTPVWHREVVTRLLDAGATSA